MPQELSMVVHIFKKMKEQKKGKKTDLHRAQEQSLWEAEGCMEITCMEMYGERVFGIVVTMGLPKAVQEADQFFHTPLLVSAQ